MKNRLTDEELELLDRAFKDIVPFPEGLTPEILTRAVAEIRHLRAELAKAPLIGKLPSLPGVKGVDRKVTFTTDERPQPGQCWRSWSLRQDRARGGRRCVLQAGHEGEHMSMADLDAAQDKAERPE